MLQGGFLIDIVEVQLCDLKEPSAISPWNHLPFRLYKSATASRALTTILDGTVPGTPVTYNHILSTVMQQTHVAAFCYLIGGQVRDILQGKISKDVDFNYACTAKDVATVCVANEWTVKYKAIGPVSKPNYVLIGDEQTDGYMEGFSISFNATEECFKQDFRQNMLFYDLTNNVILDKSGYGLEDIRNGHLRLSCAPSRNFEDWAGADMTMGQKALRYVKFLVRAKMRHEPLKEDEEECAFIATLLKKALRENAAALQGFWFGYVLGECLSTREGIETLHKWVCLRGDPSWWNEWVPFVQPKIGDAAWLDDLNTGFSVRAPDRAPLVSSEDTRARAKRVFEAADEQGDGLISQEELKFVMLEIGMTEKDFDILSQVMCTTSQGKLRYEEFIDNCIVARNFLDS